LTFGQKGRLKGASSLWEMGCPALGEEKVYLGREEEVATRFLD